MPKAGRVGYAVNGSWNVVRLRFGWRGLQSEYGPVCPVSLVISWLGKIITCLRFNIYGETSSEEGVRSRRYSTIWDCVVKQKLTDPLHFAK